MNDNPYLLNGVESERLHFRKLTDDDFNTWLEFFKDPLSTKFWTWETGEPVDLCKAWFNSQFFRYENNHGGMNVLIEKSSGKFVGQCGLLVQVVNNIELEVGYSLMPEFRGMGFATEAAARCISFAFENNLRDSVISIIHKDNIPSQNVALRNAMFMDYETTYAGNPVKIYRVRAPGLNSFPEVGSVV